MKDHKIASPLQPSIVIMVLGLIACASIIAFMTLNARGNWSYVLPFRGRKLATLLLVGYSIAVSSVLFQTISNNRILTPSIMGFDALYVLIQTLIIFFFGSIHVTSIGSNSLFIIEVLVMIVFGSLMYRWLLSGEVRNLHLLMLVGVVFGIFFRSVSNLLQRLMDPNEFAVLQDRLFANFNTVGEDALLISAVLVFAVSIAGWRIMHCFDVLALGRESAINLGLNHLRMVMIILAIITVLVSVSTALVGPVTFFGLIVSNMAYQISGSNRHNTVLPIAILLASICLVGGQVILERVFAFDTALSIIIEFLGGIVFILMLIKGAVR